MSVKIKYNCKQIEATLLLYIYKLNDSIIFYIQNIIRIHK